ncbi:MAG: glutaredoxin [Anaerolineales bacterium]|nr:glutaredoxin [Anaerolineales bacterium]
MPVLNQEIADQVRAHLADLSGSVRLVVFTQEFECQYCTETRQLAEEIAELSDRISVEVYDFTQDKEKATELGIDKIPAIAVIGAQDYGVRFYGIPAGYEFASLLQALKTVASGQTSLADETLRTLQQLEAPVHIQVFVTPTCPYCQTSVILGHQMAVASPMVRADMVEATEFPHLAMKYQVMGVPRTVINETVHIEGAVPEQVVLARMQEAVVAAQE